VTKVDGAINYKEGGVRTVSGYLIAPGLAVHRQTPVEGEPTSDWVVTHLRTGLRVGGSYRLKKDAERAGAEFAALTDWAVDAQDMKGWGAYPNLASKVEAIHSRIMAEAAGLPVTKSEASMSSTSPLLGNPIRSDRVLYAQDVSDLERKYVAQYEGAPLQTEIALKDRITKGNDWVQTHLKDPKVQAAKNLLRELELELSRVRYENELPAAVLGYVNAMVNTTSAMDLDHFLGAYVRVVIPNVLTFETDLTHGDIPF
jgi:hypothetical protein